MIGEGRKERGKGRDNDTWKSEERGAGGRKDGIEEWLGKCREGGEEGRILIEIEGLSWSGALESLFK